MARRATTESDSQADMFPELDLKNKAHKAVLAAAKAFHKIKTERTETLTTAKQEEDTAMDSLVELMHGADLKAFRFEGIEVKLVPAREKAKVKLVVEDEDEAPADDEAE